MDEAPKTNMFSSIDETSGDRIDHLIRRCMLVRASRLEKMEKTTNEKKRANLHQVVRNFGKRKLEVSEIPMPKS